LAYANIFAAEIKVDFRLPDSHDTYGRAKPRPGNDYGIGLIIPDQGYLDVAARLLDDALAQEPPPATAAIWNEETWFEDFAARGNSDLAWAAREILEWAARNNVKPQFREGGKVGGIYFLHESDPNVWLFSMWSNGVLIAENNHLKRTAAFSTDESRRELVRRLNEIPGVRLDVENASAYQRFPLSAAAEDIASFIRTYRWVLDEVVRSSPEAHGAQSD
jgi:hypothetical protein